MHLILTLFYIVCNSTLVALISVSQSTEIQQHMLFHSIYSQVADFSLNYSSKHIATNFKLLTVEQICLQFRNLSEIGEWSRWLATAASLYNNTSGIRVQILLPQNADYTVVRKFVNIFQLYWPCNVIKNSEVCVIILVYLIWVART